jgi:hypothetical protein
MCRVESSGSPTSLLLPSKTLITALGAKSFITTDSYSRAIWRSIHLGGDCCSRSALLGAAAGACMVGGGIGRSSTLYPLPSSLFPLPSTLFPLPSTLNYQLSTLSPEP